MCQKAVIFLVVLAVIKSATPHTAAPFVPKLADDEQLNQCYNDVYNAIGENRTCKVIDDFYKVMNVFKANLTNDVWNYNKKNLSSQVNTQFIRRMEAAVTHKDFKHAVLHETCVNITALNECKQKYHGENITAQNETASGPASLSYLSRQLFFEKYWPSDPTKSSCTYENTFNDCVLKNVLTKCDDTTIEYFSDQAKICDNLTNISVETVGSNKTKENKATSLTTSLGNILLALGLIKTIAFFGNLGV